MNYEDFLPHSLFDITTLYLEGNPEGIPFDTDETLPWIVI